jgi:outer membrane protein assembly factor BamB
VAYLVRAGTGEDALELPVPLRAELRRVAFLEGGRTLLLGTARGRLQALALDGHERWSRSCRGPLADLQISPEGDRLAAVDVRGEVLLLDAAGRLCWRADGRSRRARVAWLPDGGLALARGSDGRLLKLDPGGRQVWSRELPQAAERLVGTSEGCLVLAGGRAGRYDLTGSPCGEIRVGRGGSLAAVPGAPLVLLTRWRSAELRDLDGELQWTFDASGTIRTSDVAPDGSAAALFDGRTLYLLQVREEIPVLPPPRRFIEL